MKKQILSFGGITLGLFLLFTSSAQAAVSSSQSVALLSGWNIISTPKVLDSHSFSIAETSTNFDIYALDSSKASGWATLADLGQTEFTPLYGYFINNKTGTNQTLTLNYKADITPNQKLFSRTFSNTGWYSFGVANPSYVLPVGSSVIVDTNNPSHIMSGLSGYYDNVVDVTDGFHNSLPDITSASTTWKSAVESDIDSLHDFRETKGYVVFINKTNGLYSGLQNDNTGTTLGEGTVAANIDPSFNSLTTVMGGATGATIGKFIIQASGEDVKVQSLSVTPILSGVTPVSSGLNNVALFWNGLQVGSSVANGASGEPIVFTLGSSLILAAGQTGGTLEVRADLQGTDSVNYATGTVSVILNAGISNGEGMSYLDTLAVPSTSITTAGLTISAGSLGVTQSSGYAEMQNVNANTTNVKIGSYVLQNTGISEAVRVTNLAVALTFATTTVTNMSNLRTTETSGSGATPISPSSTNNFSVNFTLAPGQAKTIDIMADLGADAVGAITSTLLPTVVGVSSNAILTPVSPTTGQTINFVIGYLAIPTLNPSPASLSAQFVVGGSQNLTAASYNFVATNGTATVSELKFLIGGTAVNPVTQVCVGGVCAPVVDNVAHLTGLATSIPSGAGGANVTAQASFSAVGTNGLISNTTAILNLTFMKYTIGGVTTSTSTINVPSNMLTIVGTKPTVSLVASNDSLINGLVKLAEVTVAADAAGDLRLVTLPISMTSTGVAVIASNTSALVVKGTDGSTITSSNSDFTMSAGGTATTTITLGTGYAISAGTSKTFRIYGTAQNVSGSVNTTSISTKLSASNLLLWNDLVGGVDNITGSFIYNYPADTSVIHN